MDHQIALILGIVAIATVLSIYALSKSKGRENF